MTRRLFALLLSLCCGPALAANDAGLGAALQQAQARQAAVIVDFHAPWCYSCYYMARNVLTGAEWEAVGKRAVVLEVDADAPDGAALKEKMKVKALPSYVVLDARGAELGRILGEQTRADFYARLGEILDGAAGLDVLEARVVDGGAASVKAGRAVLRSYHARHDAGAGLAWYEGLKPAARAALARDADAALLLDRLRFLRAEEGGDVAACLAHGARALDSERLGCERAYELDRYLGCASEAPDAAALLQAQRAAAERLVADGVFGARRCADERSAVLTTADLYQRLKDTAAAQALLRKAIADVERRLGDDPGRDRNLADNLRVYLDAAGDTAKLDALMPKLIAAYPDDYVYPFRHGRSLLARGQAAAALPFLEQAATQAYGINRLKVAQERVRALRALGRTADARRVVAEALKANGPWFPEEAAKLKALLAG